MKNQKMTEIPQAGNKQSKKGWIRALIIISILTVFSLLCSFVFVKLLPSEVSVQIKTVTDILSLGGGIAIFYIVFKLLFSSFKEILPFVAILIVLASIINIYIYLKYKNQLKFFKKLDVQNEILNSNLSSVNFELDLLRKNLNAFICIFAKIENSNSIYLSLKVIEKSSKYIICKDLKNHNGELIFPLENIQVILENGDIIIIKLSKELYRAILEKENLSGEKN